MQKLVFTNSKGAVINLTESPLGITEWEGFSNVTAEIQEQQVPFVDGSVYIDNLLADRELSVTLAIDDSNNLNKRYEIRRNLIKILNPKLGQGYLTYQNNYLKKQIKCIPQTPVFETKNSDTAGTPKALLSFTACEPFWEDIDSTLVNFSLTEQPTVVNEGDVATQVKLKLGGQSTNPSIINVTTGARIGLNGLISVPVEINTEFGKKSVVGSVMGWNNIFGGVLYGIASKGENAVVVGTDGAILYTKDGLTWKSQISGTVEDLHGVTANLNFDLFVAVGTDGTVVYSEDGKEWQVGTNTFNDNLNSVACNGSKFIAVGDGGVMVSSSNGSTFAPITSPVSVTMTKIIYDGNQFVAVGRSGTIAYSEDGVTWSTAFTGSTSNLTDIAFNDNTGTYLVVGEDGAIFESVNLTHWIDDSYFSPVRLNSVCYSQFLNEFIITGNNGLILAGLSEFTERASGATINLMCSYFSKDLGLNIIGGQGYLMKSANDIDWIKCLNITSIQLHDLIYVSDLNLYVASGALGIMAVSHDGEIWESIDINLNVDIFSLAYGLGMIIGVGTGGTVVRSFDGYTWEKVVDGLVEYSYYLKITDDDYLLINQDGDKLIISTNAGLGALHSVIYNDNLKKFVAVGYGGRIIVSSDGSTWDGRASGTDLMLNDITISSDGLMVAVGEYGVIIYSHDGETWTLAVIPSQIELNGITSSPTKTKFVAVGDEGEVAISRDGINWRTLLVTEKKFNAVCYSPVYSQFVLVGEDGTIATSVDGQSWELSISGTNQNYGAIKFFTQLDEFMAVGSRGTIMSSYLSTSENLIDKLAPNSDINFNLDVGDNVLRVSCESGNPRVTVEFKNKYVGV